MDLQSEPFIIYRTHYLTSPTTPSSAARDRHFPTLAQAHAAAAASRRSVTPSLPKPRVFLEEHHPLRDHLIPKSTWRVLHTLRNAGFECYLVGGSVRDLFLRRVPKDFDVLSTASLREVKHLFPKCYIVGRRFPIVHVHMMGQIIEVSSFEETSGEIRRGNAPMDNRQRMSLFGRNGGRMPGRHRLLSPDEMAGRFRWLNISPEEMDMARRMNAFKRDFTINGLMYDPFNRILYDYVGGVKDLERPTIRTIIPADVSFDEDPARILRAVRVAARLGFPLEASTGRAIERHAHSVLTIPKSRSMLELNIMMAHGSAEASFRLLWRYRLLELLLPFHAQYLSSINCKRNMRKPNLMLDLLHTLDQSTSPDRPCDGSLWVALAAFHLSVVELQPRNVVLIAAALACSERMGAEDAVCRAKTVFDRKEKEWKENREKSLGHSEIREANQRVFELRDNGVRENGVRESELKENRQREERGDSRFRESDQRENGSRDSKRREYEEREYSYREILRDGSSPSEQRENGLKENGLRENGLRESGRVDGERNGLESEQGDTKRRENERRDSRENRRSDESRSPPERMKWVKKDQSRKQELSPDKTCGTSPVNGYGTCGTSPINGYGTCGTSPVNGYGNVYGDVHGNGYGNVHGNVHGNGYGYGNGTGNGILSNGVANGVCVGYFHQITQELKELGDAALALLLKMTDPVLAVKEIHSLTGVKADPQVLFTKAHIFKAECILRCIGGTLPNGWSGSGEAMLRPNSPNLDIDRDISETAFLFSQIIFDTILPRTIR